MKISKDRKKITHFLCCHTASTRAKLISKRVVGTLKEERGQALLEYILLSCILTVALLGASGKIQEGWERFYKRAIQVIAVPFF